MKTYLDLNDHDPEDYEGKLVTWHDIDYVLGDYVSSGASKIVHRLINRRSELCYHVIKIWRSLEEARSFETRKLPIEKLVYSELAPPTYQIFSNGGAYEIQNYLGPHEDEASPVAGLMAEATQAIKSADFLKAVRIYTEILNKKPYHTGALINCAYGLAHSNQGEEAFGLAMRALEIEPNFSLHYRAFYQYAGPLGYLRACRNQFEIMKSKLFLQKDDYEWGIQIYLSSGMPEKARTLLETRRSLQAEDNDQELIQEIEAELTAKQKAKRLFDAAWKRSSSDPSEALKLLEQISATYLKDPVSAINLGLAFRQIGGYKRAIEILTSMVHTVPFHLIPVCFANAGFCAASLGDFEAAIRYFDVTMALLRQGNHPIDPWDAPGILIFLKDDGATVEKRPDEALKVVNLVIDKYSKNHEVPTTVRELAGLYKKAAEQSN